jgi:hypothetical protein
MVWDAVFNYYQTISTLTSRSQAVDNTKHNKFQRNCIKIKEMWPVYSLLVLVILVCWELRRSLERL